MRIATALVLALTLTAGIAVGALTPPIVQKGKLQASNGRASDGLGSSVAISGRTVVAAAAGHGSAGAVYVFKRPRTGGWTNAKQTARLTPSDGVGGFGQSVAISGDAIAVSNLVYPGSVYVFEKPAGGWRNATENGKLTPADVNAFDFGRSVAISGRSVLVGATQSTVNGHFMQGAAYAFVRPAGGWSDMNETAKLVAGTGAANDYFGRVAISGDTAAIGAPGRNVAGNTPNRGIVYVFVAPSGADTWKDTDAPTATLVGSEGAEGDFLGFSVAISGPTVVAGALQDDVGLNNLQGSAYVFERPSVGWSDTIESTKLIASDGEALERLGFSTAISGDSIVLGSAAHDVAGATDQGAAYLYVKPVAGWTSATPRTESDELVASDGRADDHFAQAVGISANTIADGAPGDDVHGRSAQGSVYAFGSRKH